MECPVCFREWEPDKIPPKSLQCGHSFCADCLQGIYAKQGNDLPCPTCGLVHKLPKQKDPVASLPKNYSLIALIIEKAQRLSLAKTAKDTAVPGIPSVPSKPTAQDIEEVEQALTKGKGQCDKHKLLIAFYLWPSKTLVCERCANEGAKGATVYPIPSVR
jgi:hypothetical protein